MTAGPLAAVEQHIEETQTGMDVEERIRALSTLEAGLKELLGRTRTYLNDANLEREGIDSDGSTGATGE